MELGSRNAYVVRVNVHNRNWDGRACSNPTRHDDCRARDHFKAEYCQRGSTECWSVALFAKSGPEVSLPLRRDHPDRPTSYESAFGAQPPQVGDLVLFWGTYQDNRNFPVGMWTIDHVSDRQSPPAIVLHGSEQSVVRFVSRIANMVTLENSCSREVGGDAIRLLPADRIHGVLQRWIGDHEADLEDGQYLNRGTDEVRDALAGLQRFASAYPPPEEHLTHRPFADLVLLSPTETPEPEGADDEPESLELLAPDNLDQLFPSELVNDYRTAVEVSQLVVLAGPSGAGKTRLTHAFAQAVGAEYEVVPVRPDWHANEDLLGYQPALGGDFVSTPFTEFLLRAAREWSSAQDDGREAQRFHICIDEMNLARPEYYMAEILSRMELSAELRRVRLYEGPEDLRVPPSVELPPNLTIIGTVNNDDTTHALSPKVLDRSVYLMIDSIDLSRWANAKRGTLARELRPVLVEIDGRLAPAGMRVGYRAANQVLQWVSLERSRGADDNSSLDAALATLVFARLRVQRSEPGHREALAQLEAYLARDSAEGDEQFPRSLAAVRRLAERLERHEFAFGQFET